jgi:hypothetical protein
MMDTRARLPIDLSQSTWLGTLLVSISAFDGDWARIARFTIALAFGRNQRPITPLDLPTMQPEDHSEMSGSVKVVDDLLKTPAKRYRVLLESFHGIS